jgi:hypothetical protein
MSNNKNTEYKWTDCELEQRTTDNPIWWLKGFLIIVGWILAMLIIQHYL